MKQINFLPPAIRQRERQKRQIPFYVATVMVALASVGVFWYLWNGQEQGVAQQLARSQQQDQVRQKALDQIKAKNAQDQMALVRVKLLNGLSQQEINWTSVFARIGTVVAKDMHLTTASLAANATGVTVKVNGEAPSNLSFASFIQTLQGNTSITGMKVDTYSFAPATGKVSFALSYSLPLAAVEYQQKP